MQITSCMHGKYNKETRHAMQFTTVLTCEFSREMRNISGMHGKHTKQTPCKRLSM